MQRVPTAYTPRPHIWPFRTKVFVSVGRSGFVPLRTPSRLAVRITACFCISLILSFCHSVILSFCHSVILYSLILSFSHSLTLSFSHSLIPALVQSRILCNHGRERAPCRASGLGTRRQAAAQQSSAFALTHACVAQMTRSEPQGTPAGFSAAALTPGAPPPAPVDAETPSAAPCADVAIVCAVAAALWSIRAA